MTFARTRREVLVLKPNLGYGGFGVTIGRDTDQATWEALLDKALAAGEHWWLQERIDSRPDDLAFLIDGRVQVRATRHESLPGRWPRTGILRKLTGFGACR